MNWEDFELHGWCCNECESTNLTAKPTQDKTAVHITCNDCGNQFTNVDLCPECQSDEVYYENPNTGYGGYVCDDCGYEFPKEEIMENFNELVPVWCHCGKQMTKGNHFTVDSQVAGRLDEGYECPVCGLDIYVFKLVKSEAYWDKQISK